MRVKKIFSFILIICFVLTSFFLGYGFSVKDNPLFQKALSYYKDEDYEEWIWIPPGFAHGNYFLEPTKIEYFCTGSYNPNCEAGINPLDKDIKWINKSDMHC